MVMAHEGASETPANVRPRVRHCFKASLEDDPCQTKYLKTVWENEIHFKLLRVFVTLHSIPFYCIICYCHPISAENEFWFFLSNQWNSLFPSTLKFCWVIPCPGFHTSYITYFVCRRVHLGSHNSRHGTSLRWTKEGKKWVRFMVEVLVDKENLSWWKYFGFYCGLSNCGFHRFSESTSSGHNRTQYNTVKRIRFSVVKWTFWLSRTCMSPAWLLIQASIVFSRENVIWNEKENS